MLKNKYGKIEPSFLSFIGQLIAIKGIRDQQHPPQWVDLAILLDNSH